jgi:glycosyltransferase involved in cell wall biosynthesis
VLATRDRPRFLPLALTCYQKQSYARRELIVVDDGDRFPVDERLVESAGGRLLRTPPGTPLGTKLNRGLELGQGELCQKVDDDDWYGPAFIESMVGAWLRSRSKLCRPQVAYLAPILFFELVLWEIRQSTGKGTTGSTLLFAREDWERLPFRPLPACEDLWFAFDHARAGGRLCPIVALETYLAVRHGGSTHDRGHAWTHKPDGRTVEEVLKTEPRYRKRPEELLPPWAVERYRELGS